MAFLFNIVDAFEIEGLSQIIRATFSLNLSRNVIALQVEKRRCSYYHRMLNFPRNKVQCCKFKKIVAKRRTRIYFAQHIAAQHIAASCNTEIYCVTS